MTGHWNVNLNFKWWTFLIWLRLPLVMIYIFLLDSVQCPWLASPHSCMIWYSTCKNFGLYAISISGHLWKLIVNTNKLLWLRLIINMVSKRTCFYGLQICNHVDHLYFIFFSHFNLLYSMIYPNHLNSVSYFSTRPFDDRKSKTWFY